MGDAGGELADACELLGANQGVLGVAKLLIRQVEFLKALFELFATLGQVAQHGIELAAHRAKLIARQVLNRRGEVELGGALARHADGPHRAHNQECEKPVAQKKDDKHQKDEVVREEFARRLRPEVRALREHKKAAAEQDADADEQAKDEQ